jgi:hypothetical protein
MSQFVSRHGTASAGSSEVFAFVTDLRNFGQFIHSGSVSNMNLSREECSFTVPMVGKVFVRLAEKVEYTKVVFDGDALKKNDFVLTLHIGEINNSASDVQVELMADLNPIMKMMAVKPINQFLERLMDELEKFRGWKDLKV